MVKLADAPDSKSGGVYPPCGFDSHLRHQAFLIAPHCAGGSYRSPARGWRFIAWKTTSNVPRAAAIASMVALVMMIVPARSSIAIPKAK